MKVALVNKVNKLGGTVASWIREAFITWDPTYSGKISRWENLQGAAKRLGVTITEEEAKVLINCYDRFKTGEMHYQYLAEEIMKEDAHFLMDAKIVDRSFNATSRTPPQVTSVINKFRKAGSAYTMKSKGRLEARDVIHGTFLRFDADRTGRVDGSGLRSVASELRIGELSANDLALTLRWFDTNGSHMLDYNALIRQIFGADVTTEPMQLPQIRESVSLTALLKKSYGDTAAAAALANTSGTLGGSLSTADMQRLPTINSGFGVKPTTLERNMEVVESQAVKLARMKMKKHKILSERVKVERKLASIEEQKKKIIEDYKARRGK